MRLFGRKLKQTKCLMASNYCGQIYVKTTVKSIFVSSSPHSCVRHISTTYSAQRVSPHSLLWAACHVQGQEGQGSAHSADGGAGAVDQGDLSHRGTEDLS